MAEDTPTPNGSPAASPESAGAQGRQAAPSVRIIAQYIKDLSFENPGLTQSQMQQTQPNIDLGIDVGATAHKDGNGLYEVSVRMQAKATSGDNAMFLVELDYAGMFQLQGFQPNEMEPALLVECPRLIFPFARRIVADVTRDGGFPPLMVDPIDFRNLYLSQKQKQAQPGQATLTG